MKAIRTGTFERALRDKKGNVLVETALVMGTLGLLAIGMFDFGLAYVRKADMDNAVRAGIQFGLARHPSMGEIADGVVKAQDVRDAVWKSASFLKSDPGKDLTVDFSCQCPDGTAVQCTSSAIATLSCSDRQTYLLIGLRHDYDMLFAYPGLGRALAMQSEGAIRLN